MSELIAAINNDYIDKVQQLIEEGADVNVTNRHGETPLFIACKNENIQAATLLFEAGADINASAYDGMSIIMMAYIRKYKDVFNYILSKKPELDFPYKGKTVLHLACEDNDIAAVKSLIANNADINIPDDKGCTPLFIAYSKGYSAIVGLLLDNNANVAIHNKKGEPAIDVTNEDTFGPQITEFMHDTEITQNAEHYNIAGEYIHNLANLSEMIVLGLDTQAEEPINFKYDMIKIANNEGYSVPESSTPTFRGNKIEYTVRNETFPVGYNIFIPANIKEVQNVIISAYGGYTKEDEHALSSPTVPLPLSKHLLKAGCPVIELNLPDALQSTYQYFMDESFQEVIHAGIDKIFSTLNNDPTALSESLKEYNFSDANYFLIGASFGGRTAVRHGQLYPGTFKGYISHDGLLAESPDMVIMDRIGRSFKNPDVILPSYHIEDTQEPILMLQNRDDNNVIIATAINFYQKLIEAGKENLVRLCFFEKGSPIPDLKKYRLGNKGHFLPNTEISRYINTILDFMERGPETIPSLQNFRFLKQKYLAQQFLRRNNERERFFSLATQTYLEGKHQAIFKQGGKPWDAVWNEEYQPILRAAGEIISMIEDNEYYRAHFDDLLNSNKITDITIKNAIKHHAAAFREVYMELNDFKDISIDNIVENPIIINFYKKTLLNINTARSRDHKSFILESFFFANPDLLPSLKDSKEWPLNTLEETSEEYKQDFRKDIEKYQEQIRKTWQLAGQLTLKKQREQKEQISIDITNEDLNSPSTLYQKLFLTDTFFVGHNIASRESLKAYQNKIGNKLIEKVNSQLKIHESFTKFNEHSELAGIVKKFLKNNQYILNNNELHQVGKHLVQEDKNMDSETYQTLKEMAITMLLLDKLRSPISNNNIANSIIRQGYLEHSLDDKDIKNKAIKDFIHSLQQTHPSLTASAILSIKSFACCSNDSQINKDQDDRIEMFMHAASKGHKGALNYLLQDIPKTEWLTLLKTKDQTGMSTLMHLANIGANNIISTMFSDISVQEQLNLLNDINDIDELIQGMRALEYAAIRGHLETLSILLSNLSTEQKITLIRIKLPEYFNYTVAMLAAMNGHSAVVDFLLNILPNNQEQIDYVSIINDDGDNLLFSSIDFGESILSRFSHSDQQDLLNQVDGRGFTVLMNLFRTGDVDGFNKVLSIIKPQRRVNMLKQVSNNGYKIMLDEMTPQKIKCIDAALHMLDKNERVHLFNDKDSEGNPVLNKWINNTNAAEYLVNTIMSHIPNKDYVPDRDYCALINLTDNDYKSPLTLAVEKEHIILVNKLKNRIIYFILVGIGEKNPLSTEDRKLLEENLKNINAARLKTSNELILKDLDKAAKTITKKLQQPVPARKRKTLLTQNIRGKENIKPNIKDDLMSTIKDNKVDTVRSLVDNNMVNCLQVYDEDMPERACSLLMFAAKFGQLEMVELLLKEGAEASFSDQDNNNALHWVFENKNDEAILPIVELLLKAGLDENQVNLEGVSPLDKALNRGVNPEVIDLMKKSPSSKQSPKA